MYRVFDLDSALFYLYLIALELLQDLSLLEMTRSNIAISLYWWIPYNIIISSNLVGIAKTFQVVGWTILAFSTF
jgi:hypothetical protein